MGTVIHRLPAVIARTGLSRSTIYERIANKDFPSQVRLGPNIVGWVASEIDEWLEEQVLKSRASPHTLGEASADEEHKGD